MYPIRNPKIGEKHDYMIYCNIHPKNGESFVSAAVRIAPEKDRIHSGLALALLAAKLSKNKDKEQEVVEKNEGIRIY